MGISKKKSPVNRKNSIKAHGVTKNITKFQEIEREMTAAQPVILSGEDENNFKELCDDIKNRFCPQNEVENTLVNQMACSQWKLERLEVMTLELYEEFANMDGEIRWGDLLRTNYLKKIVRYERDINNYLLKLIYRFKHRPVLDCPTSGK